MELTEAVRRRRMTRNFSGRPLDPGVVDQLLEGALRAPSAGNTQGRDFVVLEGPDRPRATGRPPPTRPGGPRSRRFEGLSRAPVVDPGLRRPRGLRGPVPGAGQGRPDGRDREWVVPYWLSTPPSPPCTCCSAPPTWAWVRPSWGTSAARRPWRPCSASRPACAGWARCCSASPPSPTLLRLRPDGPGGPWRRACTGAAGGRRHARSLRRNRPGPDRTRRITGRRAGHPVTVNVAVAVLVAPFLVGLVNVPDTRTSPMVPWKETDVGAETGATSTTFTARCP